MVKRFREFCFHATALLHASEPPLVVVNHRPFSHFFPFGKCGASTMCDSSHLQGWSLVKTGQGRVERVFVVHEGT